MNLNPHFAIILACVISLPEIATAENILQDFTSKRDFDAFWDISTWGNDDQQYSAANVKLDTVNGWVQLKLNASPSGTKPVCGEITSKRTDFLFGSYRASIKFDSIPGAVVGWFVYKDVPDLHEIDVEFLTEDLEHIYFTLHHLQTSVDHRKDAISFEPTSAFHEYRFDWYSNKVIYYIDGRRFDSLSVKVPDAACAIMLNLWSANIDGWGGPAPTKDAYMYIDYMHYYSDYGTSTLRPDAREVKRNTDFSMVRQPARLFRCNGQLISTADYGVGFPVRIPGLYIAEPDRSDMKKRCATELSH